MRFGLEKSNHLKVASEGPRPTRPSLEEPLRLHKVAEIKKDVNLTT